MSVSTDIPPPRVIAWELTRRCHLGCRHCRASATDEKQEGELSTEEAHRFIDNLASYCRPILILTGGEPMLREDVYELAQSASRKRLRVALATCGEFLDDETVPRLIESGVRRVSVSLDGPTADSHDAFRGREGAFEQALKGIGYLRRHGLEFQINTTVTTLNVDRLDAILDLAVAQGAVTLDVFFLVPTGRGSELKEQQLSAERYEEALEWVYERQTDSAIPVKVTCAPHYQRIYRQRRKTEMTPTSEKAPRAIRRSSGCLGGRSFAFVSHTGVLQICGFLDVDCGDLRSEGFDFRHIWETSSVLEAIRDRDSYEGKCGHCEYRLVCGGCRARAYAMTGNYLGSEPFCLYHPKAPEETIVEPGTGIPPGK